MGRGVAFLGDACDLVRRMLVGNTVLQSAFRELTGKGDLARA